MMPAERIVWLADTHAASPNSALEQAIAQRRHWLDRLTRANSGIAIALAALADSAGSCWIGGQLRRDATCAVITGLELCLSRDEICRHVPPTLMALRDGAERAESTLALLSRVRLTPSEENLTVALDAADKTLNATGLLVLESKV